MTRKYSEYLHDTFAHSTIMSIYHTNILRKCFFNELICRVSKCSEWICGLTNGFICFPDNTCTQQEQSAYANCGSTFRISCCSVFNWVCIVLAIPSSAALLHHIVLFCIIAWHIGVSYLFLTDVALLIVVALWSWGKHISIHCIHGQHKNGFRLKSN